MGIDGGGSGLRVVIVDDALHVLMQTHGPAANPGAIGRDAAAGIIHQTMRRALEATNLPLESIAAVGIGVAGASATHSEEWLRRTIAAVLPGAMVAPSSDYEIALVGATGERRGLLVLAGTGSLVYGVNASGRSTLIGGWGYMLGDEGSGYWLGREGLRAVARAADGCAPPTCLTARLLDALGLADTRGLIPWLYGSATPRPGDVAGLAPLVLGVAAAGDAVAGEIVSTAAAELVGMARAAMRNLATTNLPIALAGGLLATPTPLSEAVCRALGLSRIPTPRHTPAVGAAILALMALGRQPHEKGSLP
jgi:N-acetylglucosamine kinase-like BadF-type ATPase